eukprot:sb/3473627/
MSNATNSQNLVSLGLPEHAQNCQLQDPVNARHSLLIPFRAHARWDKAALFKLRTRFSEKLVSHPHSSVPKQIKTLEKRDHDVPLLGSGIFARDSVACHSRERGEYLTQLVIGLLPLTKNRQIPASHFLIAINVSFIHVCLHFLGFICS